MISKQGCVHIALFYINLSVCQPGDFVLFIYVPINLIAHVYATIRHLEKESKEISTKQTFC